MPFALADLERIRVRVGMGTKSLREMSDTQFTAWLRAQGARGEIGVVKVSPGELMIPIEERVRRHTLLHEDLRRFFDALPHDAHPMSVLSSAVSALSTFYEDSLSVHDQEQVELSTCSTCSRWSCPPSASSPSCR